MAIRGLATLFLRSHYVYCHRSFNEFVAVGSALMRLVRYKCTTSPGEADCLVESSSYEYFLGASSRLLFHMTHLYYVNNTIRLNYCVPEFKVAKFHKLFKRMI